MFYLSLLAYNYGLQYCSDFYFILLFTRSSKMAPGFGPICQILSGHAVKPVWNNLSCIITLLTIQERRRVPLLWHQVVQVKVSAGTGNWSSDLNKPVSKMWCEDRILSIDFTVYSLYSRRKSKKLFCSSELWNVSQSKYNLCGKCLKVKNKNYYRKREACFAMNEQMRALLGWQMWLSAPKRFGQF